MGVHFLVNQIDDDEMKMEGVVNFLELFQARQAPLKMDVTSISPLNMILIDQAEVSLSKDCCCIYFWLFYLLFLLIFLTGD